MSEQPTQAAGETPWPDPKYAWYVIGVLMVAYTFSFIDRYILSLLVEPIRADLGLTDTQFSLLHGLAFALFYTFMGIPLGRVADRASRRGLIAIGVAFWSVMTAVCGLAKNFTQLFLARVGVGVGEAALSPAAYSLIADYFPPHKLGRAISVYTIGVYIGAGLAFIVSGAVIGVVAAAESITLPLLGEVRPWQVTFFIVGLPGLLVALWVLTIREPVRRGVVAGAKSEPLSALLGFVSLNRATLTAHFVGFSLLALVFNAITGWAPAYFIRTFGMTPAEVGPTLGLIILVFGSLGLWAGGAFGDWLRTRGHADSPVRAGVWGALGLAPFAACATLMPSAELALLVFCPLLFFSSFPYGVAAAALQLMTPNRLRGQVSAFYLFFVNLIGIGLGPTLTALVTDYVFRDDLAVGWSIALVSGASAALAAIVLSLGLRPYRESLARVAH